MADRKHIEKLIEIHTRNLKFLEIQTAKTDTPSLGTLHQIYENETALKELYQQLHDEFGEPIPDKFKTTGEESESDTPIPAAPPTTPGEKTAPPGGEVFISYAWGGASETIVNQLDQTLQEKGIVIVRDKRDLGFKGRIKAFMKQIGQGKCVIVVISEKYLKSSNCMFELVQIAKNGQFYDRIFPIVLDDANIYDPVERIKYIKHWEQKISELDNAMKSVGSANLQGFREDIDSYTEIRNTSAELINILKDMNTLTPDMHRESGFRDLIRAIEDKLAR